MVKMDSNMELWGFVGACDLERGGFATYHPAFVMGSDLYVAMKDDWDLDDRQSYRRASDEEKPYLTRVSGSVPLRSGDLMWVASAKLVRDIQMVCGSRLKAVSADMVSWNSLQGARFTTGDLDNFIRYSNRIYNDAATSLDNQFFDPMTKRSGLIATTFDIVESVSYREIGSPYDPVLQQHVERALYYYETKQIDNYELVRMDALSIFESLKDDADIFDEMVQSHAEYLKKRRLSDQVPEQPVASSSSIGNLLKDLFAVRNVYSVDSIQNIKNLIQS